MNTLFIPSLIRNASRKIKFSKATFTTMLCASALMLVMGTTSCATTRGFGRDVQTTGQKIQKAAN